MLRLVEIGEMTVSKTMNETAVKKQVFGLENKFLHLAMKEDESSVRDSCL